MFLQLRRESQKKISVVYKIRRLKLQCRKIRKTLPILLLPSIRIRSPKLPLAWGRLVPNKLGPMSTEQILIRWCSSHQVMR